RGLIPRRNRRPQPMPDRGRASTSNKSVHSVSYDSAGTIAWTVRFVAGPPTAGYDEPRQTEDLLWIAHRPTAFITVWVLNPALISSSTPRIPWSGIHGVRKPYREPNPKTSRSCCLSATLPVTGVM